MTEKNKSIQDLEQEFRETLKQVGKQIQDKLNEAGRLISEAEELSEQYGVPFSAHISPLGQDYFPYNIRKRWGELGEDRIEKVIKETGKWWFDINENYGGWEHSAVC